MLEILIFLGIIAVLLMILSVETESLFYSALSSSFWIIMGVSCFNVYLPYEMYNLSSGAIETGVHIVEQASPYSLLFFSIGVMMIIWSFILAFNIPEKMRKKKNEML